MEYFDEGQIRKTIACLKPDGELFEVRLIRKSPKKTISGYFTSADVLIENLRRLDCRGFNTYITLNEIRTDCYAREQHDRFIAAPEATTSDGDISGYDWLFIDLDPVRPTGTSSSDDELMQAKAVGRKVYEYLKEIGFEEPVSAMSGNGFHLLYKVALTNTPDRSNLMHHCLDALALLFNTDSIKIDTVNFNPSRICKLHGTLAQKGAGTDERPHRMSYITSIPAKILPTKLVYLEQLAAKLPQEQKPEKYNEYNPRTFDIEAWMQRYGITYKKKDGGEYTKYILDECPFDSNHKAPDACITVGSSGAIGFHCFHNSCRDKTWRDVRMKFEPDAYDFTANDERIQAGWNEHKLHNRDKALPVYEPVMTDEKKGPMFMTALQIINQPAETEDFIMTGIEGIDNRIRGLKKGYLTLVSGLRGGSKSTVLSQIALNAIADGHTVIAYSGELASRNFMRWMLLQAAGKQYAKQSDKWSSFYYVPEETQTRIVDWMKDRLLLYNNNYGNKFTELYTRIRAEVIRTKADLVILDNLMALNIRDLNPDKYEAQTIFVTQLHRLCEECNIHIIFVAHPRKAVGFLRLDDVSGSADLANLSDNAFIVHRNNEDFKRLSKEMFKWKDDNKAYSGTNVIEIAKDRDLGHQDIFIPLWYEPESKRLKNHAADSKLYGWEPDWQSAESNDFAIPF